MAKKTKAKPPQNPEGKGSTTTRDEMRARLDFTAELLASAMTYGDVVDTLCDNFDVKPRMAKRYIRSVWDRWENEGREGREMDRERQIRRVLRRIAQHDNGTGKARNPHLAFRYEHLLARILGTLAPVKLVNIDDVDVGALTDEQLRRIANGEDPNTVIGNARAAIH